MFKKHLKKEKPRIYLGSLAVAPRTDLKKQTDQWGMFKQEDLDSSLRQNLKDIFSLPLASDISNPRDNDLVLDIVIPKFQSGDALDLSLGDIGIPLIWRPKLTLSSRLYSLKSEKTIATFSVTEKMRLGQYLSRFLTWRAFLHFRPLFDSKDMEYLLYQACHRLLLKMRKTI